MENSAHAMAGGPAAAKAKKRKKRQKNEGNMWWEQPRHPVPFAQIPGLADALRERLEALGATEPSFMIGKSLVMSDVKRDQARLLFSCKRKSPLQITSVFTETEMQFVKDKEIGLLVTAFDRAGRSYDLKCKYLVSNTGYRFITQWKKYVDDNGLGLAMRVELWSFRSRKLPNRYEVRKGKDGKEKVKVMVESGHPDGSLGLVLLQYENDLLETGQAADDEPGESLPIQETETGHMESKTATTAEDKLADDDDDDSECDEPPKIRGRNTVISSGEVFYAAIGLLKLKKQFGRGRGRGGGGGSGGGGGEPRS